MALWAHQSLSFCLVMNCVKNEKTLPIPSLKRSDYLRKRPQYPESQHPYYSATSEITNLRLGNSFSFLFFPFSFFMDKIISKLMSCQRPNHNFYDLLHKHWNHFCKFIVNFPRFNRAFFLMPLFRSIIFIQQQNKIKFKEYPSFSNLLNIFCFELQILFI